jgi:tellurite resistance protein TehA-like permease
MGAPDTIFHVVGYISVVTFILMLVALVIEAAFYPMRVKRNMDDPFVSHYYGLIPVTWVLLVIAADAELSQDAYSVLIVSGRVFMRGVCRVVCRMADGT